MPFEPPAVPVFEYEFVFLAEDEIKLPPFPVKVLHGAFGNALKNSDVCVMPDLPDKECKGCGLRNECDYTFLFKNYRDPPPLLEGKQNLPGSVIFKLGRQQAYISTPAHHHLNIHLNLIGHANDRLPRVIDTMCRLGENRLSEKRLRLVEVYQNRQGYLPRLVWLNGEFKKPAPTQVIPVPVMPENIMIRFVTPYQPGGSARNQPFDIRYYLRSIIKRLALLQDLYGDQVSAPIDFQALRRVTDNARLTHNELYWYEPKGGAGYGNSGVLGHVGLAMTGLELVWPWLYQGQFFHVGSRNSYGLGEYAVVVQ